PEASLCPSPALVRSGRVAGGAKNARRALASTPRRRPQASEECAQFLTPPSTPASCAASTGREKGALEREPRREAGRSPDRGLGRTGAAGSLLDEPSFPAAGGRGLERRVQRTRSGSPGPTAPSFSLWSSLG